MSGRPQGFTLVELLIAIVLTTLMFTLGFAALRLATESWERSDRLVSAAGDLRLVGELLRRQVSQALPEPRRDGDNAPSFAGRPETLEFIAPAPAQNGRLAGLYRYRYRFERTEEGGTLLLDYRPYIPGDVEERGWDGPHETAVVLASVAEVAFSYYGPPSNREPAEWQKEWEERPRLPERVRLELQPTAGGEPWPELLLPVYAGSRG